MCAVFQINLSGSYKSVMAQPLKDDWSCIAETLKVQGTSGLGRITYTGNIPFPTKVKFLRQLHSLKFLPVHYWSQHSNNIPLCGPASVLTQ
jgi:hypothetical protein